MVINGDVHMPVMTMDAVEAQRSLSGANAVRSRLLKIGAEIRQRVPLIWNRLDREEGKTFGSRSPDKAMIEEIDPDPRPVFFTDDMLFLKEQMIGEEENPYQKIYFVDVEVSYAQGRVASYRVTGFHGTDDLN